MRTPHQPDHARLPATPCSQSSARIQAASQPAMSSSQLRPLLLVPSHFKRLRRVLLRRNGESFEISIQPMALFRALGTICLEAQARDTRLNSAQSDVKISYRFLHSSGKEEKGSIRIELPPYIISILPRQASSLIGSEVLQLSALFQHMETISQAAYLLYGAENGALSYINISYHFLYTSGKEEEGILRMDLPPAVVSILLKEHSFSLERELY